jgi:hypothetical protein
METVGRNCHWLDLPGSSGREVSLQALERSPFGGVPVSAGEAGGRPQPCAVPPDAADRWLPATKCPTQPHSPVADGAGGGASAGGSLGWNSDWWRLPESWETFPRRSSRSIFSHTRAYVEEYRFPIAGTAGGKSPIQVMRVRGREGNQRQQV